MSPRSEEQLIKLREAREENIMAVALKLFALNSYFNTSISTIAKAANISKGLVYNYFESKDALLKKILENGLAKILACIDFPRGETVERKHVVRMIDSSFLSLKNETEFWKLYFSLFFQPSVLKIIDHELLETQKKMSEFLISFFQQEGYDDPESETIAFHALIDGLSMQYIAAPHLFDLDHMKMFICRKYKLLT